MHILIVDDSATARAGLARYVERMGHRSVLAQSGAEALDLFVSAKPNMILLDVLMGDMDGYTVAQKIRRASDAQWVPIIFLSSREEDQDLEKGIEAGGDDYLVKPVSYVVLHAKVRAMQRIDDMRRRLLRLTSELEMANRELERLSHFDALTGLANRRYLDHVLASEVARACRVMTPLSICLIDIDYFKSYNDHYGHVMGDQCLSRVAAAIGGVIHRASDLAARYGGEEFAVVLPASDVEAAIRIAERILEAVRDLAIEHLDSPQRLVTVSVGLCSAVPFPGTTAVSLVEQADQALYRAKEIGRNRLVVAGEY